MEAALAESIQMFEKELEEKEKEIIDKTSQQYDE